MNRPSQLPETPPPSLAERLEIETDAEPQFGLIDVIDAFTALRHEYRSQVKETRTLSERLDGSIQTIIELETKLSELAKNTTTGNPGDIDSTDPSAKTLIELDIQLSRAVEAAVTENQLQKTKQQERQKALSQTIANQSLLSRLFARSMINAIATYQTSDQETTSTVADGLSILLTKLRQTLREQGIERVDTYGKPFDGETMNSIGLLASETIPPGHVAQQISAAYSRNKKIIRYAEVRVAP